MKLDWHYLTRWPIVKFTGEKCMAISSSLDKLVQLSALKGHIYKNLWTVQYLNEPSPPAQSLYWCVQFQDPRNIPCFSQQLLSNIFSYSPFLKLEDFRHQKELYWSQQRQKISNIPQRDAHTMQTVSCTSPEQFICPTKFVNETWLTTFRNYCTPNTTFYKTAVYLQLKAVPLQFSSVTSQLYSKGSPWSRLIW